MIRKYESNDFNEIERITRNCWTGEIEMSNELKLFIYHFLVEYYLYNNEYCLVDDDNGVVAFLLANLKNESNNSIKKFQKDIEKLSKEDKTNAIKYLEYLEYNHQKVINHMNDNDLYLGLLASLKKGSGSKLITKIKEIAKSNDIKHLYLWTDETCNYQYYEKHQFIFVEEYDANLCGNIFKTFIYQVDL